FDLPYEQITALMHPQSVIHSLVEFIDGSLLAQLSTPDMRLSILYALSYPRRYQSDLVETALTDLPALSFRELEPQRYPLFFLGLEVAKAGGLLPTVMNAANEAALKLFLERRISFKQICTVIRTAVESFPNENNPGLQKIIHSNQRVFQQVIQSTI
ncbi:MAG TPA: 1-deoxy-D-xylulose-5-phosphate reductoisomerase, partial [Candidatus Cloacimonadota bacterium]|nr:1-deoxy-D-xylulose-5-phosphate reductoisomerase [Candidatus Cloacimonadota bacterium]